VEAEAHAGQVARAVSLTKTVEDILPPVGRNAHTVIGYGQPDAAIVTVFQTDRHDATLGTELDRIVKQIGNDLLKPHRIDHGLELLRASNDKRVGGSAKLLCERHVDKRDEVGSFRFDPQLASLNLRGIEQTHHQLIQLSGLPFNSVQSGFESFGRDLALAPRIPEEQLYETPQTRDRRF